MAMSTEEGKTGIWVLAPTLLWYHPWGKRLLEGLSEGQGFATFYEVFGCSEAVLDCCLRSPLMLAEENRLLLDLKKNYFLLCISGLAFLSCWLPLYLFQNSIEKQKQVSQDCVGSSEDPCQADLFLFSSCFRCICCLIFRNLNHA